jgi:hypothetical protein
MKLKTWKQPELIILTRNKPEENVLTGCKTSGAEDFGQWNANDRCYYTPMMDCEGCMEDSTS